jgi:hypothetical protein
MTVPTLKCSMLPVRSTTAHASLIVLVPSLGTTSESWDTVALDLAETYRVLRFDLPGHGFSPAATKAFTMSEVATAVLELVDSVGGGSFYYARDSMGGAVGLTLAAEHPDRVLGVVIPGAGYAAIVGAGHLSVMERPAEALADIRSFLPVDGTFEENEIAMHVRAAVTNVVTRAEISEVILHTAIYAGLPAANEAFAIAREVFAQLDDD